MQFQSSVNLSNTRDNLVCSQGVGSLFKTTAAPKNLNIVKNYMRIQ